MKNFRRESAMSAKQGTRSSSFFSPDITVPSHEAIEQRAYLKWQGPGCPTGTALRDWLEAEAEQKAELSCAG